MREDLHDEVIFKVRANEWVSINWVKMRLGETEKCFREKKWHVQRLGVIWEYRTSEDLKEGH